MGAACWKQRAKKKEQAARTNSTSDVMGSAEQNQPKK